MPEEIQNLPDGLYKRPELEEMGLEATCPYCHSKVTQLMVRGTLIQYKCRQCNQFFRPPEQK